MSYIHKEVKQKSPEPIELLIGKPLDGHKAGNIVTLSADEFEAEVAKGMHMVHDYNPRTGGPDILHIKVSSNLLAHSRVIGKNEDAKKVVTGLNAKRKVVKKASERIKGKYKPEYIEYEEYEAKRKASKIK